LAEKGRKKQAISRYDRDFFTVSKISTSNLNKATN
jgi:hypothetical protein